MPAHSAAPGPSGLRAAMRAQLRAQPRALRVASGASPGHTVTSRGAAVDAARGRRSAGPVPAPYGGDTWGGNTTAPDTCAGEADHAK